MATNIDCSAPRIARLADHAGCIDALRGWFEQEWPEYYGPGGPGDAAADLQSFARHTGLPLGLVALDGDSLLGIAALKAAAFDSHRHLTPWASAGLVRPDLRRRGIGAQLIAGLAREAASQGFTQVYCATATAHTLLRRNGWRLLESVRHDGQALGIYARHCGAATGA